jgi:hypothetical protein
MIVLDVELRRPEGKHRSVSSSVPAVDARPLIQDGVEHPGLVGRVDPAGFTERYDRLRDPL